MKNNGDHFSIEQMRISLEKLKDIIIVFKCSKCLERKYVEYVTEDPKGVNLSEFKDKKRRHIAPVLSRHGQETPSGWYNCGTFVPVAVYKKVKGELTLTAAADTLFGK